MINKGIPASLLDILACPICKSSLGYNKLNKTLICVKCKKEYAVKKNIPMLMPK